MYSTYLEHPNVHPQFCDVSFMHPYKQSGRWHDVFDAYTDPRKKYHKIACTSLPEDEHLDVRNMPKAL